MEILAPAKINLSLDIVGRRPDGYHLLDMVMQSVSLYDKVCLEETDSDCIEVRCSESDVPCGKENTVFRAADAFFQGTNVHRQSGLLFTIQKNIPRQAGLGGGSADAAAALKLLNRFYHTSLSGKRMREIALFAGADVPFCVEGGTAHVTGIGESVSEINPMMACNIVICRPDIGVSTKEAYGLFDRGKSSVTAYTSGLLKAIATQRLDEIGHTLGNAFEATAVPPQIPEIEAEMIRSGSEGSCMSGSGSAVFGLFGKEENARRCCDLLQERYSNVFLCRPVAKQSV